MRRLGAGQVDERRKLLVVTQILDANRFRGGWRGQHYECRGVPGTAGMAVGDLQFGHVLPNNTELAAPCRVAVGADQLWFSPGAPVAGPAAELWLLEKGSDIPEHVWTCPNSWEYVTHIAWSKVDNEMYVFTYFETATDCYVTVYRVNRTTRTLTQIAQVSESIAWPNPVNLDPVVDSAQFLDKLYLLCGSYYIIGGNVWVFDPLAGTLVHDFHFPLENGYGGGIGTNMANDTCYASDGADVYRNNGGGWVYDHDLTTWSCWDSYAGLTDWENNLFYHALKSQIDEAVDPQVVERDNATGVWSASLVDAANDAGTIALCHTFDETTGALDEVFALAWGWFPTASAGRLWRRAPGGVWTFDGTVGTNLMALATQSICQFDNKVYILLWGSWDTVWLYRRESAGSYTLLKQWTDLRIFLLTHAPSTGMARAPRPNATPAEYALMRRCHEVN